MEAQKRILPHDIDSLYLQMQGGLVAHCRRKGLSEEEAYDVVQNSFMTLIESLPRFKGNSKLSTFFYGIFLNKLREFYRSKKRLTLLNDKVENNLDVCFAVKTLEVEDPVKHCQLNESVKEVHQAVSKLKPRTQEIFMKRFVLGFDHKSLAEEFGLKENNIRQILLRAKNAIIKSAQPALAFA